MPNKALVRSLHWLSFFLLSMNALALPERPEFEPPRWYVTLRVPPGTASRGGAITIPVEVSEFQPRDLTQAADTTALLPQPATPDQPIPYKWDFAHGLGMLMRPDNPIPTQCYVLRPDRLAAASIRAMIGALSPKLRADAEFQQKLRTLGVAVFGLKAGDNLSSVFPGVPLRAGAPKLGNNLAQLHFKASFPYIPVEKVTNANPANVTAESNYKFESIDPVFQKALATDGIGAVGNAGDNSYTFANAALDSALNFGEGNADDKNNKTRMFDIKFDLGYIPRGDTQLESVTGNISRTNSPDPNSFVYRVYPNASADGVVDFNGWCQLTKTDQAGAANNQVEIYVSPLACTDQAELRTELMTLVYKAWRLRKILTESNYTPVGTGYSLVQTLLRMNEPLWTWLVLRRVIKHTGPRLKVLGDELVPQLDPLSTRIWQDRYTRNESFINALETVVQTYKDKPGGIDEDSFHPLCADQLTYDLNRAWLTAMRTDVGETFANPFKATPLSLSKIAEIQGRLVKRLLRIVAAGYHRGEQPVSMADTFAATQPGRGKFTSEPKLEPDLVWLQRASNGILPGTSNVSTSFAFDSGADVNGFVRPFIILGDSLFAKNLTQLVEANTLGVHWLKDANLMPKPPELPKDTYFRFIHDTVDVGELASVLESMKQVCKPAQLSERVRSDATGKEKGFSEDWFNNTFKPSLPASQPVTDTDTETWQYMRLTTALVAETTTMGKSELIVTPQYVHVKQAPGTREGLDFAGTGTEGAVSAALRRAVLIDLELIDRLMPPDTSTLDELAVQRRKAKKAFVEQALLAKMLRPGNELVLDLWERVLNGLGDGGPANRLKLQGKLAADVAGAKLMILKRVNGAVVEANP